MPEDKQWRYWPGQCDNCGGNSELKIYTSSEREGFGYQGDPVQCLECGYPTELQSDTDEEDWYEWHLKIVSGLNPTCNCKWCFDDNYPDYHPFMINQWKP